MHAEAVATPMFSAEPHPVVDSSGEVLLSLRERIRRATTEEVQLRWKLLLRQLERLAGLTALELARKGTPDPTTLRTVVATIEGRCSEASDSTVGLLACQIACAALSGSRRAREGSRVGRSAVLASFEGLRLDARTLFEWAKADLWTAIARMAVLEANRTAEALEGSTVLPHPGRTVVNPGGTRVEGDALAQVAEDLAIRELTRLLALARKTPVRTPRGPNEAPLRRRVVRSAVPTYGRSPDPLDRRSPGLAAVVQRFGTPEVIRVKAVTVPAPDAGPVPIRVQAAGVAHTEKCSG